MTKHALRGEIAAPAIKWGLMEWVGLAAAAAIGVILGAPYLYAAVWLAMN